MGVVLWFLKKVKKIQKKFPTVVVGNLSVFKSDIYI